MSLLLLHLFFDSLRGFDVACFERARVTALL